MVPFKGLTARGLAWKRLQEIQAGMCERWRPIDSYLEPEDIRQDLLDIISYLDSRTLNVEGVSGGRSDRLTDKKCSDT